MRSKLGPAGEETFLILLEAFALGDAFGMPAEFMTRLEILQKLAGASGLIEEFAEPFRSLNHSNLGRARITDDTEQNLWLLDAYLRAGELSAEVTARALLDWVAKTGAVEKRYIGPSSMSALKAIELGADPRTAGLGGRTCGGIMRAPAAVLFALSRGAELGRCVLESCIPTHYTSTALEAAMAYARALEAAINAPRASPNIDEAAERIIAAALAGAEEGRGLGPYELCAPSLTERIEHLRTILPGFANGGELLDFLYGVYGTGLESVDVAAAVFGIFLFAKDDAWLAIRMGASVGGDTDTIAALAGALSAAFAGRRCVPAPLFEEVRKANGLELEALCRRLRGTGNP